MRSKLIVLLVLSAMTTVGSQALGQLHDPIEKARIFPPSELTTSENETNLRAIDWHLERKVHLVKQYRVSVDRIKKELLKLSTEAEHLANEIPSEIRFVNAEVRSRLVGKAMEELLNARLNLATQTVTHTLLEQLHKTKLSTGNSNRGELEINVKAAEMKLNVARIVAKKTANLSSKGLKSESEKAMSQYTADIAELELERAKQKLKQGDSSDSELAKRLANSRIEVEPIKARVVAAEKYLKSFSDSAQIHREIEKVQRVLDNLGTDWKIVMGESNAISREVEELKVLRSLVQRALERAASEQDK